MEAFKNLLGFFEDLQVNKNTCKDCEHRQRHQCGGSVIQYCGVRSSNRTENGLLKIKCKTPACHKFKKQK